MGGIPRAEGPTRIAGSGVDGCHMPHGKVFDLLFSLSPCLARPIQTLQMMGAGKPQARHLAQVLLTATLGASPSQPSSAES